MNESSLKKLRVIAAHCAVLVGCIAVASCATPAKRIDARAANAQLRRTIEQGTVFQHVVYARDVASDATLTVFLEGDGIPWRDGRVPAADPTTRNPIALELMLASQGSALYVSRPCYQSLGDARCRPEVWTFARYGNEVVESMARIIAMQAERKSAKSLRLVGYSGGGVLAVLIAERLERVSEVVTIAANLDVAAWSAHHGYLPLTDSLDPAGSTHSHRFRELHLQGARDRTVPSASTRRYFDRYPHAEVRTFADFDHACCWVTEWPRIEVELREPQR